jgi:effector-binding domain-containing protein
MITTTASDIEIKEVSLSSRMIAGLRERVAISDLAGFFARTVSAVAAELARAGIAPSGPPVTVYRQELGNTFEVTVGFPVPRMPATGALIETRLPGGRAVQAVHIGSYATLPGTYGRLSEWFAGRRLQPPGMMWEEYLVGPDARGEAGCLTRVVFPIT